MVKRCLFCGRYFKPDPRVGQNQKVCFRDCCKRARKQLAQNDWFRRNPDYFRGRYWYVKQWRQRRKELVHVKFHIILTHNSQIKLPYFSHSVNEVR